MILCIIMATSSPDKIPPQDLESEKSVLGSLMIDREAMHRVADILLPRDFYQKQNRTIYEAMLSLYEKQEPIDILSVSSRMQDKKLLEQTGGKSYLTELVNTVPTATHVTHYAQTIKNKSVLRHLIEASYNIAQLGYREGENINTLVNEAEQLIFQISQRSAFGQFIEVKNELQKAFTRIQEIQDDPTVLHGIPTGFKDLDELLAGFHPGDLIIIASRPSVGKTSLALDIARNVFKYHKKNVGIFSLEMPKEQILERMLAAEANIDLQLMRKGGLERKGEFDDFERLNKALDTLSQATIFINDMPTANMLQIRAQARRLKTERGLDLIIIDYLQLIDPINIRESRVQQITEISRGLKALARELNTPVIALSQLSRNVEQRGGEPQLSDLRDSGSIEQDADIVIFLHREKQRGSEDDIFGDGDFAGDITGQDQEIIKVLIRKHRNGPTGVRKLNFLKKYVKFEEPIKLSAQNYQSNNDA